MKNPLSKYPSRDEVEEAIAVALSVARDQDLSVALVGGIAMQFYGSDRLTKDVAFVACDIPLMDKRLKFDRKLSFGGRAFRTSSGIPVDFIARDDGYEELYDEALSKAVVIDGFPVVTPPYLAAMKLSAMREKDRLDLSFLLSKMTAMDISRTRKVVERLLGGQFAVDELDLAVSEAKWISKRGGLR